jgi:amidase
MADAALHFATLTDLAALIRRKAVSPVAVTQAMLDRIAVVDRGLHSYVTVLPERALQQARAAEDEIARGIYRGPLHGVPIAVKDLCWTRGIRTTGGTPVLRDYVPEHDATVVARLEAAGAVLLGKLGLTECAMFGYPPPFDEPVNPWTGAHYAGGSSSGSGVATAGGLCFAALGTDTGGSIRLPSALCGTVGIKPTYGRVSRYGVLPLAESLDHVGPMTRSVADAAVVLGVIAGHDPADSTSWRLPVPDYTAELRGGLRGVRIGVDAAGCTDMVHPETTAAVLAAVDRLRELGASISQVQLPPLDEALAAWWTITLAEMVVAHAAHFPARAAEYGVAARGLLEEGARTSGVDYARAHATRLALCGHMQALFVDIDLLACPSWQAPAPPLALIPADQPLARDLALPSVRLTAPYDLTGQPTISVPCGFSSEGLPLGVQLVGRPFEEGLLCRAAYAYEQASDWHYRHPAL